MSITNYQHAANLRLFETYLKDLRMGLLVAIVVIIIMAIGFFQVVNKPLVATWIAIILAIDVLKLVWIYFFKSTFDLTEFKRYQLWHLPLQTLSGLAWGSTCFFLMITSMALKDDLLVITVLTVVAAYSASVMSASLKGMAAYLVPLITCMLVFFGLNIAIYPWWFSSIALLGLSSILFGYINHQHVKAQIENQLLNERYIDELNELKTSMQEANMHLVQKNEALIGAQKRLELLAVKDEMTGLYNRRYIIDLLNKSLAEFSRYREDFVVVLADIDFFKKINDTYGHAAGDEVIKGFASLLKLEIRKIDTIARYGGEEFLMVLPKTNAHKAEKIVQRLCDIVAGKPYQFNGQQVKVTASFGLAEYVAGDTVEKLIDRADQALYRAKTAGRNNVKVFAKEDIAA